MNKPNILYLHCHDAGRYVQPYGHAISTPNIQKLAEEGVLFRKAFCVNPTCSPSRAALLTGSYPHCNGMLGLSHRDYSQHIVHTLHHAEYESALSGVQHVAPKTDQASKVIGYDRMLSPKGKPADIADAAIRYLDEKKSSTDPFFLDVGFHPPHRMGESFYAEFPAGDGRYDLPPPLLPDTPETRADMAAFKASVRTTDLYFGKILDQLKSCGLDRNTLVICTTDHGIAFPGMKCNLTDHGIGVMLILKGPRGFEGGRVIDEMVSHMDLYPTMCDLAGVPISAWVNGKSLFPLLDGKVEDLHEELFVEVNHHAAYEPMRGVRTKRWKYFRRFGGRERRVLANCDNSASKTVWHGKGWVDQPYETEELYDLIFDPQERRNLAKVAAHRQIMHEMRAKVEAWMRQTLDPLLDGPIPVPEGGFTTSTDAYSPNEKPLATESAP
jgi:N-sulfoglucosamine sulfohydrolase